MRDPLRLYRADEERRRAVHARLAEKDAAWRTGWQDRNRGIDPQTVSDDPELQAEYEKGYRTANEREGERHGSGDDR